MVHSVQIIMLAPTWPEVALLLTLTAVSLFLFFRRFLPVVNIIRASKSEPGVEMNLTRKRIGSFVSEVLLQTKVIQERPLPGLAHALVFWGFLAFALVTLNHFAVGVGFRMLDPEGGFGRLYFGVAAAFAVAVIVGMVGLAVRRFIVQPKWLGTVSKESGVIALLILILMATYLAGYQWLPEGSPDGRLNWWLHTMALLVFLPLIPHTKHLHLVLSPAAILLKRERFSQIPPLQGDEDFGIETGKDITNIVALQAFSCVECGRCTEHCPANNTGKLLDPKKVILGVRQYLRDQGANATEPIVGKYVPDEMLWQCTSCGACEYQCPVGIQHLPVIIGMRRAQVNTGKWEDPQGSKLFLALEKNGNALGMSASEREKFVQKNSIPIFDGSQDYCLWLGCMGSYDPRGREIILALREVFDFLGTTYGVLKKERCTGDPVRRLGNDLLFADLIEKNVESIRAAKAVKLISICPHCVRTIAEDWREAGVEVEIEHHSEFLARHIGQLPQGGEERTRVAFHDPCYLGRYRGSYDEARDIVERDALIVEPERTQRRSFCCGAGGGRAFLGEEEGKRVSVERVEQLVATGASAIGAACPFCQTMFRDALTHIAPNGPKLFDIAQIAANSLPNRAVPSAN